MTTDNQCRSRRKRKREARVGNLRSSPGRDTLRLQDMPTDRRESPLMINPGPAKNPCHQQTIVVKRPALLKQKGHCLQRSGREKAACRRLTGNGLLQVVASPWKEGDGSAQWTSQTGAGKAQRMCPGVKVQVQAGHPAGIRTTGLRRETGGMSLVTEGRILHWRATAGINRDQTGSRAGVAGPPPRTVTKSDSRRPRSGGTRRGTPVDMRGSGTETGTGAEIAGRPPRTPAVTATAGLCPRVGGAGVCPRTRTPGSLNPNPGWIVVRDRVCRTETGVTGISRCRQRQPGTETEIGTGRRGLPREGSRIAGREPVTEVGGRCRPSRTEAKPAAEEQERPRTDSSEKNALPSVETIQSPAEDDRPLSDSRNWIE